MILARAKCYRPYYILRGVYRMSFLLIMTAAWGVGSRCLRSFPFVDALEAACLRILTGLVPVALVALWAGSFSLVAAQSVLACVAILSLVGHYRSPVSTPRFSEWVSSPFSLLEKAGCLAIGGAAALTLLGALAPVTNWDACVAHLALPAEYTRLGHIALDTGNVYAGYPHLLHSLFAVAFYSGNGGHELPVSLLSWSFGLLACLAIYSLGRRVGTRQTGLVAAALLATAPIYMDQASGVGIDLPFVAFSTATLTALVIMHRTGQWVALMLAAVLAGSACGIRHTGFLIVLILLVAVAVYAPAGQRLRAVGLFAALAFVAALPWFGRSWWLTGNPVFPFLLSVFPQGPIDHIAISTPGAHESIERARGLSLWALLRFPWDIIMRPQDYDGWSKSPGGMVLVLGVPGLILGGARAWSLGTYSAAGGMVFFFFQRLARYILPFFTPMMVVAALVPERMSRGRGLVVSILCFSFVYGLGLHAAAVHFKVGVVLGRQTKTEYLTERVERYGAFQYANEHLNDGGRLLVLDQRSYYIDGPTYQNHWSLQRIATEPLEAQVAWLKANDIEYIMIPTDYVNSSGALAGAVATMLQQWRESPAFFEAIDRPLHLPRRGGSGVEEVAFYAVR